ncbi:MAG: methyltransferase domain-containing protein [Nitrospirae bacterium]|nr:methyltransferase domain-containing protein [Nitrospirota bacterium]
MAKRVLRQFCDRGQSRFENGRLYLPRVYVKQLGTTHRVKLRVIQEAPKYIFELEEIEPSPYQIDKHDQRISFCCNICGSINTEVAMDIVSNREAASCGTCHSSLRMRSVINALSVELLGESIQLPAFPVSRNIRGIGLSDWEGYASRLKNKLSYINTFYHQVPRLDITNIPDDEIGKYDFVISSDVMEHVSYKDLGKAFTNMARLLKSGGFLLLTVPYKPDGDTDEYYPDLHDFKFITTKEKTFLYNRTVDGVEQIFNNLVFHGGGGFTLEMRMFSESGLLKVLADNGFAGGVRIYRDNDEKYGIAW